MPGARSALGVLRSRVVRFSGKRETVVSTFEAAYLRGMLDRHAGNFTRAAAAAGLDRMHFKRLLQKYER